MVDHDVTGFIEKTDAIEGFAKRLEALLQSSELREEVGASSRARAIRDFSFSSTASRASAAYRLAVSKDSCDSRVSIPSQHYIIAFTSRTICNRRLGIFLLELPYSCILKPRRFSYQDDGL